MPSATTIRDCISTGTAHTTTLHTHRICILPFDSFSYEIKMATPADFGLTDADVKRVMSATLNTNITEIFVYGIYTTVYFITMGQLSASSSLCTVILDLTSLLNPVAKGFKQRAGMAVLVTLMWSMVSIHAGLRWNELNFTFIENGATRVDELEASFINLDFQSLRILSGVTAVINVFIADAIVVCALLVWRTFQYGLLGARSGDVGSYGAITG